MAINNMVDPGAQDVTYQPTGEEMVLDTADFDIFSSLDDLVVEDVNTQENKKQDDDVAVEDSDADATEDGEDFEDGEDDGNFDFEDIEDDDLEEADRKPKAEDEDDDEDLEDEDEDDDDDEYEDEDEYEEEEGDEVEDEVDYETYEITLPDGDSITLQAAIEGYRSHEAIEQAKIDFEVAKSAFKEEAGNTLSYLKLAKLEADRVIDDYVDFDWGELSRKDPQAYVENREFLDKYRARKSEIVMAMDELESQEQEIKQTEFKAQAQTCLGTLKAEIPGWNDTLYQDLMQYAIDNGTEEDVIADCVDPSVFKMLNKARQFDLGKQVVKAKIKRKVGSPKKVVKSASRNTAKKVSDRDKIANKLAQGITSDSDVFDALED